MTVRPVVVVGEPVLHRAARPVTPEEIGGDALHALVTDLLETMDAANGVGLAANQIGDDRRVFVFDCPDEARQEGRRSGAELDPIPRRRGVVVNPVLETTERPETMPDPDDDEEGCLSVPGESFPTGRATWARVTGTDADGEPVSVAGEGYLARCLQHETDHLDGLVYVDRLVGRHKRGAKRALRSHGWGVPGHSWMPGVDPDPFGH